MIYTPSTPEEIELQEQIRTLKNIIELLVVALMVVVVGGGLLIGGLL